MRTLVLTFMLLSTATASAAGPPPGSVVGRNIFGLARDVNDDPLLIFEKTVIYEDTGFEQRLQADGKTFIVSGFDDVLGGLYLSSYDVDQQRYLDTDSFDLASVGGLSKPTGGIATSWGSLLFTESQMADASRPLGFVDAFKPFYKGEANLVKPYNYGWVTEAILLDGSGASKVIKNYSVGRVSASQLFMMPDGRSLYMHDTDNAGMLYLYVAADANNLSDGTLYGISLDAGKPVYEKLGSASALRMKLKLKKIDFDDLFIKKADDGGRCDTGFSFVSTIYGDECLKLNKKNKRYAGLLEPVRTLALRRQGRPVSAFDRVGFDGSKGVAELAVRGDSVTSYRLGRDDAIGSSYIISEVIK